MPTDLRSWSKNWGCTLVSNWNVASLLVSLSHSKVKMARIMQQFDGIESDSGSLWWRLWLTHCMFGSIPGSKPGHAWWILYGNIVALRASICTLCHGTASQYRYVGKYLGHMRSAVHFLAWVVNGECSEFSEEQVELSPLVHWQVVSVAQDLIFMASKGGRGRRTCKTQLYLWRFFILLEPDKFAQVLYRFGHRYLRPSAARNGEFACWRAAERAKQWVSALASWDWVCNYGKLPW